MVAEDDLWDCVFGIYEQYRSNQTEKLFSSILKVNKHVVRSICVGDIETVIQIRDYLLMEFAGARFIDDFPYRHPKELEEFENYWLGKIHELCDLIYLFEFEYEKKGDKHDNTCL